jgi:thiol-disulfide isomerase/thioredoxin
MDGRDRRGWGRAAALLLAVASATVAFAVVVASARAGARQEPRSTAAESVPSAKSIGERLGGLRNLPDEERAGATRQLALDIRRLPASAAKLNLSVGLASLSTEGDFGRDTLQEVATTLEAALRERPTALVPGTGLSPYVVLARLVRYEGVNFWATWCPPCRKELPDLEALYRRFEKQGFVVLGVTDEKAETVRPFVERQPLTYPVLLDPGRAVNDRFKVDSIPRTFVFDRQGKLAAQAIDMRTRKQLLDLLARAGLGEGG